MSQLRLIFAGSGAFGLPTLKAIRQAGCNLLQVLSQPDRPAGRGRHLTPTPIAQYALEQGLPLVRTGDLNAEQLPDADLMLVIAFGQKISSTIVNYPRLGSVNLHASLLPRHRGAAPIHHAILAGDKQTGNSIIRLAQRMDAGAILAQSRLTIGDTETTGQLHDRLAQDGATLMLQVLQQLADGTATETPQNETFATQAPKLSRAVAHLDFQQDAALLARMIRGLSPWPGCRIQLIDPSGQSIARLTLLCARATQSQPSTPPGQINPDGTITAANGTIEILQLQPEGGRAMSLADYRNGYPWQSGLKVQSI